MVRGVFLMLLVLATATVAVKEVVQLQISDYPFADNMKTLANRFNAQSTTIEVVVKVCLHLIHHCYAGSDR